MEIRLTAPGGIHASIPRLDQEVCLHPGEDTELHGETMLAAAAETVINKGRDRLQMSDGRDTNTREGNAKLASPQSHNRKKQEEPGHPTF